MRFQTNNILSAEIALQTNPWDNSFITLRANAALINDELVDLIDYTRIFGGYELKYSFKSVIGPIEASLMAPNDFNEFIFYLNIGYWF